MRRRELLRKSPWPISSGRARHFSLCNAKHCSRWVGSQLHLRNPRTPMHWSPISARVLDLYARGACRAPQRTGPCRGRLPAACRSGQGYPYDLRKVRMPGPHGAAICGACMGRVLHALGFWTRALGRSVGPVPFGFGAAFPIPSPNRFDHEANVLWRAAGARLRTHEQLGCYSTRLSGEVKRLTSDRCRCSARCPEQALAGAIWRGPLPF